MSTEDHQDPVTSLARQREQAAALVAEQGQIVVEFFDIGQSRPLAWARRPQAATLVAALADPERGWDAIVIGEYERGVLRQPVRGDGAVVRALRHPAMGPRKSAGGRCRR